MRTCGIMWGLKCPLSSIISHELKQTHTPHSSYTHLFSYKSAYTFCLHACDFPCPRFASHLSPCNTKSYTSLNPLQYHLPGEVFPACSLLFTSSVITLSHTNTHTCPCSQYNLGVLQPTVALLGIHFSLGPTRLWVPQRQKLVFESLESHTIDNTHATLNKYVLNE